MAQLMLVNPRKRRKAKRKTKRRSTSIARRRSYSPKRRVRRIRRRRNPIAKKMSVKSVIGTFQNGAIGSLGAIAGSVVGGFLPIPAQFKEGNLAPVVQALIGIGTGFMVGKFMNPKIGEKMAEGSVTVALHSTMKNMISNVAPNLNLGEYDDGLLGVHDYDGGLLGGDWDTDDLGWTNAAPVTDDMGAYSDESMSAYTHDF